MLSTHLYISGIETKQTHVDAGLLIATTAIEVAETHPIVVIGDATDLFVFFATTPNMTAVKLYSSPKQEKNTKLVKL